MNKITKTLFFFSYLIRFLSRVAEHSSINKMTASNLGICIGCSLLYAKEQPSNPSLPTSYTNSSTIIELMITHHKKLFPSNNQTDIQPPNRPQPDIIPVFPPSVNHFFILFMILKLVIFRKSNRLQLKI
jgi:hypothetical protein